MLRISRKGDYAVFILGFMAQRGAFPNSGADRSEADQLGPQQPEPHGPSRAPIGGPALLCSAQEISQHTLLQKAIVANLLKDLTRAGLLESVRGIHGGYRLASHPDQISLGQILRVVEGPQTLVDCTQDLQAGPAPDHHQHGCRLEGHCPSRSPMRILHERIRRMIDEIKLPELCGLRTAHTACTPNLLTNR
jgi:Rrf2 family protein